jgi:hypothetical protein
MHDNHNNKTREILSRLKAKTDIKINFKPVKINVDVLVIHEKDEFQNNDANLPDLL